MSRSDNEDIARMLRGQKRRIDRLEQEREPEGVVNLLRAVADRMVASDSASRTVVEATPGRWDQDDWDNTLEWG